MPDPILATFSDEEKNKILYHLGYLIGTLSGSVALGFPRASQPMFLVMQAFNYIPSSGIGIIRRQIAVLDLIEDRLIESQERLAASKLGDITLNEGEPDKLEKEYCRWAKRMADTLGVPLNIYSERFRGMSMNINVSF